MPGAFSKSTPPSTTDRCTICWVGSAHPASSRIYIARGRRPAPSARGLLGRADRTARPIFHSESVRTRRTLLAPLDVFNPGGVPLAARLLVEEGGGGEAADALGFERPRRRGGSSLPAVAS